MWRLKWLWKKLRKFRWRPGLAPGHPDALRKEDFSQIADILAEAERITPQPQLLQEWRRVELRVQLSLRWREPAADDPEFERHLGILASVLESGQGYGAYLKRLEAET